VPGWGGLVDARARGGVGSGFDSGGEGDFFHRCVGGASFRNRHGDGRSGCIHHRADFGDEPIHGRLKDGCRHLDDPNDAQGEHDDGRKRENPARCRVAQESVGKGGQNGGASFVVDVHLLGTVGVA